MRLQGWTALWLAAAIACAVRSGNAKIVEGRLKTLDEWAFLSRFCFISGRGRFEYLIEFERRYGEPQLLLYYDDMSQWPSVYKTKTTCQQKVAVLTNSDHQVVTLTARPPHNFYSGCTLQTRYPEAKPALPIATPFPPHGGIGGADTVTSYYDRFLTSTARTFTSDWSTEAGSSEDPTASTTTESSAEDELFGSTSADLLLLDDDEADGGVVVEFSNDTDVFNVSTARRAGRHGGSLENSLENGTEFRLDVEQMFSDDGGERSGASVRLRRAIPAPVKFKRDGVGTVLVQCSNIGGFTSSRERWWYIAIANCGSRKGIDLKYKFRLTNGHRGDFWHEHFSADEMYILPIYLTELLLYALLLLLTFGCWMQLRKLHLLHCTYRLFTFSVLLQCQGILLNVIAFGMYAASGLGPRTLLGGLFTGASEIAFLTLLLLMAKGYTITRARISSLSAIKLTVFVNVYTVVYVSLFVFQAETFDPGEVLNLYESPAGVAHAVLRVGAWAAFLVATVNTVKKNPEKSGFYVPFGLLGSMWIVGGPAATVFGVTLLDPWVRESVICFVLAVEAFVGHAAFLYLTWPSRANRSFPYHVKTNHVGIASTEDDGADYPRHVYEPARAQLPEPDTIIPLSRRTEELLSSAYGSYLVQRLETREATAPQLSPRRGQPQFRQMMKQQQQQAEPPKREGSAAMQAMEMARNGQEEVEHHENDDSGHPSLETSTSITPTDTGGRQSPAEVAPPPAPPLPVPPLLFNGAAGRPNPFVVNGVQRAPNKIILEPIERPLALELERAAEAEAERAQARSASSQRVPKHLFAARNPNNV